MKSWDVLPKYVARVSLARENAKGRSALEPPYVYTLFFNFFQ